MVSARPSVREVPCSIPSCDLKSKRVGVVDPGGMAKLYGLWEWVGMAPRMGPESRSCTFPLGRPVSRKAGKYINK